MKYIYVNFKANHTRNSSKKYFDMLDKGLMEAKYINKDNANRASSVKISKEKGLDSKNITIFANQASLFNQEKFRNFYIGAQNAYPVKNGAFTGEIGLEVLQSFNIKNILLGHSERRNILKEDNGLVLQKFNFFKENNFNITFCIGESIEIFNTKDEIKPFLQSQLDGIDLDYKNLIIAYEPIWAIGSGKSASMEDINNAKEILQSIGVKTMLYGGSVNIDNAKDICKIVDGLLIGGFGLEVENILKLNMTLIHGI